MLSSLVATLLAPKAHIVLLQETLLTIATCYCNLRNVFFQSKSIFDNDYNHDERLINKFLIGFVNEITMPVDENIMDHSYEYAATQVIAEYLRSKNHDGICFNSSVSDGKSYVFFYGADPKHMSNAYPYPFGDLYLSKMFPILTPFTEFFEINDVELIEA